MSSADSPATEAVPPTIDTSIGLVGEVVRLKERVRELEAQIEDEGEQ